MRSIDRRIIYTVLFICLGWSVAACGTVTHTVQPSLTPVPSFTITPTLLPSITPTATSMPPAVVLLAPTGAEQSLVDRLQSSLSELITASGFQMQVMQTLSMDDLTPNVKLVLALPPDPGLSQLVSATPGTQFLAIGIPGLEASTNLTMIQSADERPDQQGFIAGVIAAMIAPDWRVGVISVADSVDGRSARTGFLNGVEYYCGLCRPAHPPFYEYPLYFELPSTATSADWQEAARYMADQDALAVYIAPGAGDTSMLASLAQAGINIIGSTDPPEAARKTWALSLAIDPLPLIREQVERLLESSLAGGQTMTAPIQFSKVNPTLFTPGKQRLAGQILSDLQAGFIDTGVDLTSGENKP